MKKVLSIACIALLLTALFMPAVLAEEETNYIYDNASLLNDSEYSEVQSALKTVSKAHGIDVIALTVDDYQEFFSKQYNKDFNTIDDASEYVCKNVLYNKNNVLLMISMSERDWCIASNEKGHDAFTAYGREYIGDAINEDLHDGDYKDAFTDFADLADEFLVEYEKGTPYDTNHKKMTMTDYLFRFGIPAAAGLIIGLIAVFSVKKKYKPVQLKAEANDYLIQGSLQVHNAYDHFIYTHVSRTRKAKQSSSSHDSGSFGSTSGKF
ncbi:MAG: TPM domain-containing protein [Ruminococcus sp.]|nr:TPM domain-containing protein [Ruminococcus sp.]